MAIWKDLIRNETKEIPVEIGPTVTILPLFVKILPKLQIINDKIIEKGNENAGRFKAISDRKTLYCSLLQSQSLLCCKSFTADIWT